MTLPDGGSSDPFELPPPKPGRDYDEEPPAPPLPLMPMAPRQREMVESFKKTIIQHVENRGEKVTEEFLDDLALDLWRLTREG